VVPLLKNTQGLRPVAIFDEIRPGLSRDQRRRPAYPGAAHPRLAGHAGSSSPSTFAALQGWTPLCATPPLPASGRRGRPPGRGT
jgi:hypothetical protein